MRRWVLLFAFSALVLCAAVQAQDAPDAGQDKAAREAEYLQRSVFRKAGETRYAELSQLPSPRDRAVALLQAQPFVPVEAALLRQLAAPDDLLVQWVAMHLEAEEGDSCSRRGPDPALADRVLQLEFDDAAAHFPRLLLALETDDGLAIDSSLAAMAAAARFDSHVFDLIDASMQLWRRFPLPAQQLSWSEGTDDDPETVFAGQSLVDAVRALPSYKPLVKACDAGQAGVGVDLRRYAACGDIGRLMSRSAAWIDRSFGYIVLQKSGQLDAQDRAAQQQYEALRLRFAQAVDPVPYAAGAFLHAMAELRDETAAAELVLAALAK